MFNILHQTSTLEHSNVDQLKW